MSTRSKISDLQVFELEYRKIKVVVLVRSKSIVTAAIHCRLKEKERLLLGMYILIKTFYIILTP
jgi:hypothetical protein